MENDAQMVDLATVQQYVGSGEKSTPIVKACQVCLAYVAALLITASANRSHRINTPVPLRSPAFRTSSPPPYLLSRERGTNRHTHRQEENTMQRHAGATGERGWGGGKRNVQQEPTSNSLAVQACGIACTNAVEQAGGKPALRHIPHTISTFNTPPFFEARSVPSGGYISTPGKTTFNHSSSAVSAVDTDNTAVPTYPHRQRSSGRRSRRAFGRCGTLCPPPACRRQGSSWGQTGSPCPLPSG